MIRLRFLFAALVLSVASASAQTKPSAADLTIKTAHFALEFYVGDDGRLYQRSLDAHTAKYPRDEEAYPQGGDGYIWEPALQVVHADGNTSTDLKFDSAEKTAEADGQQLTRIHLHDPVYPFHVTLCFRAHPSQDLIEQWTEIHNEEAETIVLERVYSSALLFPTNMYLTHFYGDWVDEMHAATELLTPGTKTLDSKIGVRAHQFGNPSFVLSFDHPATETSGRVLAGSLEWSGSFACSFDDNSFQTRALCGINPFSSAYHLRPNETFTTPIMIWVYSDQGLGAMSRKFHDWARDFGIRDGHQPRSVLLNNWEATEFNFDFNRIAGLFGPAKEIGSELFLLDDGWFGNKYPRTNDHAGLGDWKPNLERLPNGLAPLAAEAIKRGLTFGIWMEPEMVNPKSELYDAHPDWVIRQPFRELEYQRNQLVLDLTRPAVRDFEFSAISNILGVPGISYAKWDCNRYLTQPGSSYLAPYRQSDLWIDYVHGLYALMDKIVAAFPQTELMLCSGGGGRVDYGALHHFHEFWASDNTDPVDRVRMQWNYSYFFPVMAQCSHVTHSGNRPMHFACTVAMSARFGMDLDLNRLPSGDKAICAGAISAYKRVRDVIHLGDIYRLENPKEGPRGVMNFVSKDEARAVVFAFQLQDASPDPVRPQGLDPARNYTVRELNPAPGRAALSEEGKTMTGADLMRNGVVPTCRKALEACAIELAP